MRYRNNTFQRKITSLKGADYATLVCFLWMSIEQARRQHANAAVKSDYVFGGENYFVSVFISFRQTDYDSDSEFDTTMGIIFG